MSSLPELQPSPVDASDDRLVGTVLDGRYLIEERLGQGGMGLVYRARHTVLNKPLAIKVLRRQTAAQPELVERFRREAQSASAIGSPHIIDVLDFGQTPEGIAYFAMEYVNGPSLSSISKTGPMDGLRIARIAIQVCDALQSAHEAGIVHRDLKPDNVHVVTDGDGTDFVKVLDFGIAKVAGSASKLTTDQQLFGTPHYMAPEQCSPGQMIDGRVDIYALGVMLFEMATGRLPFDAESPIAILGMHIFEPPPLLSSLNCATLPVELDRIIQKCLAKLPADRFGSMAALKEALLEAYPELALTSRPSSSTNRRLTKLNERAPLRGGLWRHWTVYALVACMVAGSLVSIPLAWASPEPTFAHKNLALINDHEALLAKNELHEDDALGGDESATVTTEVVSTDVVGETSEVEVEQVQAPDVILLTTATRTARVYRDGHFIGRTPLEIERPDTGDSLALNLRARGYRTMSVELNEESPDDLRVVMRRRPISNTADTRQHEAADSTGDWSTVDRSGELLDPYDHFLRRGV